MTQAYDEILRSIPELTLKEKASLAHMLLRELDGEPDQDAEQLWIEEATRRWEAYKRGEIEAIPGDEVMRNIRERFDQKRSKNLEYIGSRRSPK